MNYWIIALVILIIIILYYFYSYMTNNALVAGLQPLNTPLSWTFEKLLNPTSLVYSYQCWMFVTATPNGPAPIFFRGDPGNDNPHEFELVLDDKLNLVIKANTVGGLKPVMNVMGPIPLQKWTYVAINVSQKTVEAYVNGRLTKTVNVSGLSNPSMMAGLTIGNSTLTGYLTKFYRLPEALDAQTVQKNYLKGNGMNNWFANAFPYGMQFTVTNGESASRVIKLF
jgi:hypothetical protein